MDLFSQICNTVNKSTRPDIVDLIPDDFDENDQFDEGMEALGKVHKSKDPDDLMEGLSEEEIEALENDGAEYEEEDDGFDEESVEDLLRDYPEDVYSQEIQQVLSNQDLDDIDDDIDDE